MMNAYRHPDADQLIPHVAEIIDPLSDLIARARERDDVPRDGVAHIDPDLRDAALRIMEQNMGAQLVSAAKSLD